MAVQAAKKWLWVLPALATGSTVCFILSDALGKTILFPSTTWKFSVIVLCLLFALFNFVLTSRGDAAFRARGFLLLAMGMTLVSDLFLLLLDAHYEVGVATFILAQSFHAACIARKGTWRACNLLLRAGAPALILGVLAARNLLTPLYALAAIYAVQLLGNLGEHTIRFFSAKGKGERWREGMAALGFLLFLGCDLCVGLSNIGVRAVGFWIWVFYAPSQILIVSAQKGRICNESPCD